jgi:hypothetical protein
MENALHIHALVSVGVASIASCQPETQPCQPDLVQWASYPSRDGALALLTVFLIPDPT